nr:histidine kinase dimerization/phosphoacceptor domain -containing protein [Sphingobium subterraneum]
MGYLVAIVVSFLALLTRIAVDHILPIGFPFVTFFPGIILTSFLFGVRPGIVAATVSGGLSYFFFVDPAHTAAFSRSTAVAMSFYLFVVATDILLIHLMQRANAFLAQERERNRELAETRQILFGELQHRVSNNLQVVSALLTLQRARISDEEAGRSLDDASVRIALIGKISRGLYSAEQTVQPIDDFVSRLVPDILLAAGRSDVRFTMDAQPGLMLRADAVVPFALVVAEAVNNAVEHAFADRHAPQLNVHIGSDAEAMVSVSIADDGPGLSADFAMDQERNLGLRIAKTLARQLKGVFRIETRAEGGAEARLTFPL